MENFYLKRKQENPKLPEQFVLEDTINYYVDVIRKQHDRYDPTKGRYQITIEKFKETNPYIMGYKGYSGFDAGLYYCPYIPNSK